VRAGSGRLGVGISQVGQVSLSQAVGSSCLQSISKFPSPVTSTGTVRRHSRTVTGPLIAPPPPLAAPQKFLGLRRFFCQCPHTAHNLSGTCRGSVRPTSRGAPGPPICHGRCQWQLEPQAAPAAATVADSAYGCHWHRDSECKWHWQ
jgi:hypothetical protein